MPAASLLRLKNPIIRRPFVVYENGLHLDFSRNGDDGFHYSKAPGAQPIFGALSSFITTTRAGTATRINGAGLVENVPANTARIDWASGQPELLREAASANLLAAGTPRDLTNVAWVKVGCNAALDQVGNDGVAASASSLTATAPLATCLQAIVGAAVVRPFAVDIRRISGSGPIRITADGTTYQQVTFTRAGFARFVVTATQLNPLVGFQIDTNGDSIAVDYAQLEAQAVSTSRIITGGGARNADLYSSALGAWFNGANIGTLAARLSYGIAAGVGNQFAMRFSDNSFNNQIAINCTNGGFAQVASASGGVGDGVVSGLLAITPETELCVVGTLGGLNDLRGARDGTLGNADVAVTVPAALTRLDIGSDHAGTNAALVARIKSLHYWPEAQANAEIVNRSLQ